MSTGIERVESEAEQDVLRAIRDMYAAFVADDRRRFDSHLAQGVTTWESHLPRLYDRPELDAYRDNRTPAERPRLSALHVVPQRVDVWQQTAVARYVLVSVPAAEGADHGTTRVTDVLRHGADGWRIVHHHAERRDVSEAWHA